MTLSSRKSKSKPHWIKVSLLPIGESYKQVSRAVKKKGLATVCEEALCPNRGECWSSGTATIMLMGDTCTRNCKFCSVRVGSPKGWLDPLEPLKAAKIVEELNLNYVVLTSVARDDLPDGGAHHIARTIETIREHHPKVLIEVLIPDFKGDETSLKTVLEARPDVLAHNIETVRRLTPLVRDRRASYDTSLQVLKRSKEIIPEIYTKSSIMVGLGETDVEIIETMRDLKTNGVDILTIGQYLQPSRQQLDVVEYIHPDKFLEWEKIGKQLGFLFVASGPLVRSSYKAGEYFLQNHLNQQENGSLVGKPKPLS